MLGPYSAEHRAKISVALKGMARTDDHCKALAARVVTPEWRARMSEAKIRDAANRIDQRFMEDMVRFSRQVRKE